MAKTAKFGLADTLYQQLAGLDAYNNGK
jgi:hypothetical protein